MSNNPPSPGPTPVAAPTAIPRYVLPNIPANAYQLLSNLADAIDTANTKLNGHAAKLSDITSSTNNAINDVTSTSKGQTTDTLAGVWQGSQTDLKTAHDQLTTITTYSGGLGQGNQSKGEAYNLRSLLEENKSTIQTGLTALENLQNQQSGHPSTYATNQQLEQWKQAVDALDNSMSNVNMVIQAMAMAIRGTNDSFSPVCATGFTPGAPIPTFTQKAFANQMNDGRSSSGDGKISAQQLEDYIKAKEGSDKPSEAAAFIPILAEERGLDLDSIKALIDEGVDPEHVYKWLMDDTQYKITNDSLNETLANVKLLVSRGGDATQSATWLQGLDDDQLALMKNRAEQSPKMSADDLKQLVDPQLEYEPNKKHDVKRAGVGPQPTNGQRALDNSVSYKSDTSSRVAIDPVTEEIVVLDDTNNGKFHGHVETWNELDQDQQNALSNNGFIDSRGRVIIRDGQGNIVRYGRNVKKGN